MITIFLTNDDLKSFTERGTLKVFTKDHVIMLQLDK